MGSGYLMTDEEGFKKLAETWTNVSVLMKKSDKTDDRFDKMEAGMSDRFDKMEVHMMEMINRMSRLKCDVHDEKLRNIEEKFALQGKLPCDANEQRFKTVEGHIKWMGGFVATVITASIIYIGKFMGAGPK